ncbi:MAG TPA: TIGR02921 family PEP-CTERM protein [Crinalium sp.]
MKKLIDFLCSAIFWVWNLTFLLLVYGGVLPNGAPYLIHDALAGEIPFTFIVSFAGLTITPVICTILGYRLRTQPILLLRLFYGVEAPIFALCLLRLFVIREMTPASIQILGSLALCIGALAIELLLGFAVRRRRLAWLQMASHSLMLIIGVYVGVLLAFYTVPALCVFIYGFFQFGWLQSLGDLFLSDRLSVVLWGTMMMFLFGLTCILFFAMPFVMVNLFLQSWWRAFSTFGNRYGSLKAGATTVGVAIAWFLLFSVLQQQPQTQAFELLNRPAQTDRDRQEILAHSDTIRAGLVNAYLAAYRYISPWNESNQLRQMYQEVFNLTQPQAQFWQDWHNHWLSPFLYNGSHHDAEKAAELYAQFFDAPIQKAERPAIQHALQSTLNRDETQAGLININQRIVRLAQQRVTVQEHGDWAEIELYEQYENATSNDQEIFYSFSLPESATITGLWLGDTAQLNRRFPFVVSPRGAAQQVYKEEVERSNVQPAADPALLEQVGPRQYRLRVFPIPAQLDPQHPGTLHLWLTYKTMQQESGWPLPQLTEKRNIFWTNNTIRQRGEKTIHLSEEEWLEPVLPRHRQKPSLHQIDLPSGDRIIARPLTDKDYRLPQAKRFAVVIDSSRSMSAHARELNDTVRWLTKQANQTDVDIYLTASEGGKPRRIDDLRQLKPDKITFYGSLQISQLLWQFAQLRGDTSYDAVLLLTDEGSYELSKDETERPAIASPLWAIHLGGKLPPAYDDATLEVIQRSRGGVSADLPEVMRRMATEASLGNSAASVVDGYAWLVEPADAQSTGTPANSESNMAPLAARQLLLKLSRDRDMTQLASLDEVHAIAKQTAIVTPYSSMLVLVNDQQRELLRLAEANRDRFNREVENGQDTLTQPGNPLNVSVPEPGDVFGLGVVAIAFLFVAKRKSRL